MLIFGAVILFFIFSMLRAFMLEMEKRDALLLNATLHGNMTFLLDPELESLWRTVQRLENLTSQEGHHQQGTQLELATVEPDWSLVLGQFQHDKDEKFEEFLIAIGAPYFVRNIILSASPTVLVERFPIGHDYYYDLDHYMDEEYKNFVDAEDEPYQVMVTTSTFLISSTRSFRPGYTFKMIDRDGTESKNTFLYLSPTVLIQYKVKEEYTLNIIWSYDAEGFTTTIINKNNGMQAKRHFKRIE